MADKAKKPNKKEKVTKPANNIAELKAQINNLRGELFKIKLEHAQGKLKNTSSITQKRKEIAKLLTTMRIIELTQ